MHTFFKTLPQNIVNVFRGRNLFWHGIAIIITYACVVSGFDWLYFTSTRNATLSLILFPAIIIGGIVPLLVPIVALAWGAMTRREKMKKFAWTVGQAAIIGSFVSGLYKAFTGRFQPNLLNTATDISQAFHFGFLRHGIFWGWPSSHTTIAFAMAVTLIYMYPKNTFVKYAALIYALYIGIGVSTSIHWFSDFVAGMIIGSVIGVVVGKGYQKLSQR